MGSRLTGSKYIFLGSRLHFTSKTPHLVLNEPGQNALRTNEKYKKLKIDTYFPMVLSRDEIGMIRLDHLIARRDPRWQR
jgi:hypothetical protein